MVVSITTLLIKAKENKSHKSAKILVLTPVREVVKTIIHARDPPKLIETTVSYGSPPPPPTPILTPMASMITPPPLTRRCMVSFIIIIFCNFLLFLFEKSSQYIISINYLQYNTYNKRTYNTLSTINCVQYVT